MAIIDEGVKITEEEIAGKDISSLPDRPNANNGLSAEDLKARFDTLVKMAITSINAIVDALNNGITNGAVGDILVVPLPSGNIELPRAIESLSLEIENSISDIGIRSFTDDGGNQYDVLSWASIDEDKNELTAIPIMFIGDIASGATKGHVPTYRTASNLQAQTPETGSDYDLINRAFLYTLFNALKKEFEDNIAKAVSSAYSYRGSVDTYSDLPLGAANGDVYDVKSEFSSGDKTYPAGTNVVWGEDGWEVLTGFIDVTKLVQKIPGTQFVYAKDGTGTETAIRYSSQAGADSIPIRDDNGNFYIGEGTNEYYCATVGQVNKKVDKTSVSMEATANTIAERSPDGNVRTKNPVAATDCINLEYFNKAVGTINDALDILLNGGVDNG